MNTKDNQQLELFKSELDQAWEERHRLGRLYYDIYNLKFFVYDMKDEKRKLKPVVKRDIKVNNHNITLKLRPQTISDDTEVKTRYLGELEQNVLDFILYKLSQDNYTMLNQKPYVIISLNEIRSKLKYDLKRIKQSLFLLSSYSIEFETKEGFEGNIPNQLIEEIIIGTQGRNRHSLVKLSKGLMNYVYENKYLLMNYENMFELSRIGKILYKRICISNYMEFGETEKQKFVMNETICSLLSKYGIEYKNRLQKSRLFKEIYNSLDLMKQKNIIGHYEVKEIKSNNIITDFKLTLFLTKEFSNRFSAYQLNKNRLEKEQAERHIMKMKKQFLETQKKV